MMEVTGKGRACIPEGLDQLNKVCLKSTEKNEEKFHDCRSRYKLHCKEYSYNLAMYSTNNVVILKAFTSFLQSWHPGRLILQQQNLAYGFKVAISTPY